MKLVVELDEPHRSTIIGRFVEGRTASIAQSLGIPAGTVRKRLHEALSRLRAGLDADVGDRTPWAPAVLAFANGGLQVAKPTKLGVVVLTALLLTSAVMLVIRRVGGTTAPTPSPQIATSSSAAPEGPNKSDAATDTRALRPVSEHRAAERAATLAAIARAREAREHRAAAFATSSPDAAITRGSDSTATTLGITDKTGDMSDWGKRRAPQICELAIAGLDRRHEGTERNDELLRDFLGDEHGRGLPDDRFEEPELLGLPRKGALLPVAG